MVVPKNIVRAVGNSPKLLAALKKVFKDDKEILIPKICITPPTPTIPFVESISNLEVIFTPATPTDEQPTLSEGMTLQEFQEDIQQRPKLRRLPVFNRPTWNDTAGPLKVAELTPSDRGNIPGEMRPPFS